jgi:phosphoglycolate phosphatase-like HAD superfamily hydrolase
MDFQTQLSNFRPSKEFFIGIDSDGCVFDTMELKQKKFFIPAAIEHFHLYAIEDVLQETWEFVNLYSIHRGGNRLLSLIKVFELLGKREEVIKERIPLPDLDPLKIWAKNETKLGNDTLRKYYESTLDSRIGAVLNWSEEINRQISERMGKAHLFAGAIKAIESIVSYADAIVVSQTPLEALEREWEEHGIRKYVNIIAGQEHGTKAEHIALTAKGKYSDDKILLIGDAFGDKNAAEDNGILSFPVIPGKEDLSWKIFLEEGSGKFREGTFRGNYQSELNNEFVKSLPEVPPWDKNAS